MNFRSLGILLVWIGGICPPLPGQTSGDAADPVEQGRQAFQAEEFNWYDADDDQLRPINLRQIAEPSNDRRGLSGASWFADLGIALSYALLILALAVVLGVMIFLLSKYRRRTSLAPTAGMQPRKRRVQIEALPVELDRNPEDWLARVQQHYQAGEYNLAMIYLYSHQLVELDKHHLIHLTKGKTNRQYLKELQRNTSANLAPFVERSMVTFEEAFFGDRQISRAQFEACWQYFPQFQQVLGSHSP